MSRLIFWAILALCIGACSIAAWFLAPATGLPPKEAFVVALVLCYFVLSAVVGLQRKRLRRWVETLPEDKRLALAQRDPEVRFALPPKGAPSPAVTTMIGAFAINGPALSLIVVPLAVLQYGLGVREPLPSVVSLIIGITCSWLWWSIAVTIWRWWAVFRRGLSPEEAQWRGEKASFLWPRGHFFERTELGHILWAIARRP